jgi:hypothetical protein
LLFPKFNFFWKEKVMMKKLLVLLTVLAMSSVASAAMIAPVITSLNGEAIAPTNYIEIGYSDTVDFDIWLVNAEGMKLMSLDALVSINGLATLDASIETLTWPYAEGFNNWVWDVQGKSGAVATGSFMAGMGEGILVDHFLLHCDVDDPENDVIISVSNDLRWGGTLLIDGITAYAGEWGSATVHQVPEPMTIALLGLGGLFLRRRR